MKKKSGSAPDSIWLVNCPISTCPSSTKLVFKIKHHVTLSSPHRSAQALALSLVSHAAQHTHPTHSHISRGTSHAHATNSARMALKFDDECSKTVEEVRSDKFELNWVAFKYEGKAKILLGGKGSGGYVHPPRPCFALPSLKMRSSYPRHLQVNPRDTAPDMWLEESVSRLCGA